MFVLYYNFFSDETTNQQNLSQSSPTDSQLNGPVEQGFSAFTQISSRGNSLSSYQDAEARSRVLNGNYG